jgi:tetratricopeptide (TPR) repeat protein
MIKYIFPFIFIFALQHSAAGQRSTIDSLQEILKTTREDSNKVNILNALSYELLYSNTDTTIYFATLAKNLSEQLNYSRGIASAYLRLGQAYNNKGSYDQSQLYLSKALASSTDKLTTAKIYVNIGINHYEMSNYAEALKNYFIGLKSFEEAGDKKAIGSVYNNIALIYSDMGNYGDALKNHLAAKKIREANGDKRGIAGSYLNIGIIHFALGNYGEALKNYSEAQKLYEALGDKNEVALAYHHIGTVYRNQKNYSEALKNYLAALKIQEEIGDKEGIAITCNSIGTAYVEDGKTSQAGEWLTKSLALAKEIGIKTTIQDSYLSLSRADSASGNYKGAYENHKMYIIYRDSIANKVNTEKVVQQKMQYEFDKKEAQSRAEQAMTKKELQRQKLVRNGFVGGFVLVLLLVGVTYNRFRLKQKSNRQISQALNELKETQKQLIQSEKMAAFGVMASRVAHEIQNPLNFVNNFSEISEEMTSEIIEAKSEEERKESLKLLVHNLQKIKQHGKKADNIIKQLLEHTRAGTAHEFFEGK